MTSDFLVVGAGIHGLTAAYHLARRGHSVVVLDKGGVADGPTGDASGVVRAYYTNEFLAQIALESIGVLEELEQRDDAESGFRRLGGLYLHGPDERAQVVANARALSAAGVPATVLSPDEIADAHPGLELHGVAVGVWEPGAGVANPYRTARSYAQDLRALDVELCLAERVTTIDEGSTGVVVGTATGRSFAAERLLIAAGPWTAPLARLVGSQLPLAAERHVVAGLRHAPDDLGGAIGHVLIDVVAGYYSRPWGDDGFVLGPLAATEPTDPDRLDRVIGREEFVWLADRAAARAPVRGRAEAARSWASLYDVSPDWQPVIGRIGERTFVDAGTSGHGFKLAPVLGDHVARLLLDEPDDRIAQFSPDRFALGSALASGFGAARILG